MDFNGNQTVQGPNESFSAALNDTRRWIKVLSIGPFVRVMTLI